MERSYGNLKPASHKGTPDDLTFFREGLSADDLAVAAKQPFKRFRPESDRLGAFNVVDDIDDGCAESCEPFKEDEL